MPRFLVDEETAGINSGLMNVKYTAASLVSVNKVLCHPASVDSIPTSANQEDHNSMGSVSSRKCFDVVNNVKKVIAIEIMCAAQGMDFLRPLKSGKGTEQAYLNVRKKSDHISDDVITSDYILKTVETVFDEKFLSTIEAKTGKLE